MENGTQSKRVTSTDVAAAAGVSRTTVSKILNNRKINVPPDTRARVVKTAQEMGYRPNQIARALKTGSIGVMGVWAPSITWRYNAEIIGHLHDLIWASQFGMSLTETLDLPEALANNTHWIFNMAVDGLIILDDPQWCRRMRDMNNDFPMPLVSIGAYIIRDVDSIFIDLVPAATATARHLVESGRKRIATVTQFDDTERLRAYKQVMAEEGRPVEIIKASLGTRGGVYHAVTEYVRNLGLPDALMCHNDDYAIGACRALNDLGLKVPGDVAVVGCDGIEDTEYYNPRISTIMQPTHEMCELAWRLLQRRMADPQAAIESHVLTPKLVVRESSR